MQQQPDMGIMTPALVQALCPRDLAINMSYPPLLTLGSATSPLTVRSVVSEHCKPTVQVTFQ